MHTSAATPASSTNRAGTMTVPKPRVSHSRPASGFDASAAKAYSVKYRDTPGYAAGVAHGQQQRDVDAVGHARKRRHDGDRGPPGSVQEVPQA